LINLLKIGSGNKIMLRHYIILLKYLQSLIFKIIRFNQQTKTPFAFLSLF